MSVALLGLVGVVEGRDVLDLACGHGRHTRELTRRGAGAVGVDVSQRFIAAAEESEREQPLGIRYLLADGRFVFAILHPCFPGSGDVSGAWPAGGTYYQERWWLADGVRSKLRSRVGG